MRELRMNRRELLAGAGAGAAMLFAAGCGGDGPQINISPFQAVCAGTTVRIQWRKGDAEGTTVRVVSFDADPRERVEGLSGLTTTGVLYEGSDTSGEIAVEPTQFTHYALEVDGRFVAHQSVWVASPETPLRLRFVSGCNCQSWTPEANVGGSQGGVCIPEQRVAAIGGTTTPSPEFSSDGLFVREPATLDPNMKVSIVQNVSPFAAWVRYTPTDKRENLGPGQRFTIDPPNPSLGFAACRSDNVLTRDDRNASVQLDVFFVC